MELKGKIALVTGAAGAIGQGIVEDLIKKGAEVFATDLQADALAATCKELGCKGKAADVIKEDEVKSVVESCIETYGGVDILVNVAGVIGTSPIEEITESSWDLIMDVNCKGTFFFCKYAVPAIKKRGSGKIINFSSKSGKTGSALMTHYCAAKGAIIGFTQALAYELASNNINVNCVCPGITDNTGVWDTCSASYINDMKLTKEEVIKQFTAKIPLKRLAAVKDVVAVTTFLASEGSDYMTGQAINITGGREMH